MPGSVVVTDGWKSYTPNTMEGYRHEPVTVSRSGDPAHVSLQEVHRVASLLKRWLLGTHQGAVEVDHLQGVSGRVRLSLQSTSVGISRTPLSSAIGLPSLFCCGPRPR